MKARAPVSRQMRWIAGILCCGSATIGGRHDWRAFPFPRQSDTLYAVSSRTEMAAAGLATEPRTPGRHPAAPLCGFRGSQLASADSAAADAASCVPAHVRARLGRAGPVSSLRCAAARPDFTGTAIVISSALTGTQTSGISVDAGLS